MGFAMLTDDYRSMVPRCLIGQPLTSALIEGS